jgi:hypothetical protein
MSSEPLDQAKVCTNCGVSRRKSEFRRDSRASDGRQSSCKKCARARDKIRHLERVLERRKRERDELPVPESLPPTDERSSANDWGLIEMTGCNPEGKPAEG